jgi:hypothetical protein
MLGRDDLLTRKYIKIPEGSQGENLRSQIRTCLDVSMTRLYWRGQRKLVDKTRGEHALLAGYSADSL